MDFIKEQPQEKLAKVFKSGNSEGIRLTKKDTELFKVKAGDEVIKEISPDGMTITFKRIPKVSSKTKNLVNKILKEDSDLINALKDL